MLIALTMLVSAGHPLTLDSGAFTVADELRGRGSTTRPVAARPWGLLAVVELVLLLIGDDGIGVAAYERCGERVPEHVRGQVLIEPGSGGDAGDRVVGAFGAQAPAARTCSWTGRRWVTTSTPTHSRSCRPARSGTGEARLGLAVALCLSKRPVIETSCVGSGAVYLRLE